MFALQCLVFRPLLGHVRVGALFVVSARHNRGIPTSCRIRAPNEQIRRATITNE